MTAQDYQRKVALLRAYEAMLRNPAYLEFHAKIEEEFANCIAGLRNRKIPVSERQEFQEGADLAERLKTFAADRIVALKKETALSQVELDTLKDGFEPENEG